MWPRAEAKVQEEEEEHRRLQSDYIKCKFIYFLVLVTMGTGSFPGVKRPGSGAYHPHHPSAEVMKG